ncbi:MAG: hypothetical protein WHS86_15950 [Desulfosoma sp.]
MGEFIGIATRIARQISAMAAEQGGISPQDLPEIGSRAAGREEINIYPGVPGYRCHELSLFISLSSPTVVKGRRGHLSCRQALEKMVQHMQGTCMGKTNIAILVTDSWDAAAADEWAGNLRQIARMAHLEIYLIAGPNVSQIYM